MQRKEWRLFHREAKSEHLHRDRRGCKYCACTVQVQSMKCGHTAQIGMYSTRLYKHAIPYLQHALHMYTATATYRYVEIHCAPTSESVYRMYSLHVLYISTYSLHTPSNHQVILTDIQFRILSLSLTKCLLHTLQGARMVIR